MLGEHAKEGGLLAGFPTNTPSLLGKARGIPTAGALLTPVRPRAFWTETQPWTDSC